ncbi:hypothetical protein QR680_008410 [Steinernema hermaphroditum]|uniref:G-patch domain-containing protein n=1 Tax=Steinernema hermaphroditum TaxID=289476 RepID=A0AA39IGH8_9BILA|nr:hypothetical protein QR680_008410 [Steinernema hermaphroditum]
MISSCVGISECGEIDITVHMNETLLERFAVEKKLSLEISLRCGEELAPAAPAPEYSSSSHFEPPTPRLQYRDHARERRQQFGLDPGFQADETEAPVDSASAEAHAAMKPVTPMNSTNIGSKVLENHGWIEDEDFGKSVQEIMNPMEEERRIQGADLATAESEMHGNSSMKRKEQMRVAMIKPVEVLDYNRDYSSYGVLPPNGPDNGINHNLQWGWAGYGMTDEQIAEIERKNEESRARVALKIKNGEL